MSNANILHLATMLTDFSFRPKLISDKLSHSSSIGSGSSSSSGPQCYAHAFRAAATPGEYTASFRVRQLRVAVRVFMLIIRGQSTVLRSKWLQLCRYVVWYRKPPSRIMRPSSAGLASWRLASRRNLA